MIRILALALSLAAVPVAATEFIFEHRGWLAATDSLVGPDGVDLVDGDTEFTFRARFDDQSPDLVEVLPFPGIVAYAPIWAEITIGGATYRVVGAGEDPAYGVGVTLFDPSNPIFPGFYGAGFIANPLADGAGIIADFGTASPDFSVDALTTTVFGDYRGAGFLAGIGCNPGNPGPCVPRPLALFDADSAAWFLGFEAPFANRDVPPLHTASLLAVPEPATWGMMIAGFGLVGGTTRARRSAVAR